VVVLFNSDLNALRQSMEKLAKEATEPLEKQLTAHLVLVGVADAHFSPVSQIVEDIKNTPDHPSTLLMPLVEDKELMEWFFLPKDLDKLKQKLKSAKPDSEDSKETPIERDFNRLPENSVAILTMMHELHQQQCAINSGGDSLFFLITPEDFAEAAQPAASEEESLEKKKKKAKQCKEGFQQFKQLGQSKIHVCWITGPWNVDRKRYTIVTVHAQSALWFNAPSLDHSSVYKLLCNSTAVFTGLDGNCDIADIEKDENDWNKSASRLIPPPSLLFPCESKHIVNNAEEIKQHMLPSSPHVKINEDTKLDEFITSFWETVKVFIKDPNTHSFLNRFHGKIIIKRQLAARGVLNCVGFYM